MESDDKVRVRKNGKLLVDKNDPLNYIGDEYGFMEEDGYTGNIYTELHQKPRSYPWSDWKHLKGSSYHKTQWVPVDGRREDNRSKRRIWRDPNHPFWIPRYGLLRWWRIRIQLLGTDDEGRQVIMIRKGRSEPIYMRFGRIIEITRKGKTLSFDD